MKHRAYAEKVSAHQLAVLQTYKNVISKVGDLFAHGLRQEVVDALTAPLETKITIVYRFQNVHLEFVLQNE